MRACGKYTRRGIYKKAISLGSSGIWFTDHAPFPGNPFGGRMEYAALQEYMETLRGLKDKYQGVIDVHIGLEVEYFPSYDKTEYYDELRGTRGMEMLLLGHHMAETGSGTYTFMWDRKRLENEEYAALGEAIMQGIGSGYFNAVAHPDRIYRKRTTWDAGTQTVAEKIIAMARGRKIPLEQNEASKHFKKI